MKIGNVATPNIPVPAETTKPEKTDKTQETPQVETKQEAATQGAPRQSESGPSPEAVDTAAATALAEERGIGGEVSEKV